MLAFVCLGLLPFPSRALEPLTVPTTPLAVRTRLTLEDYTTHKLGIQLETLDILASDLNTDGIDELILHKKNCALQETACDFSILADTKNGIVPLGTIKGRKILLGNHFSHGVRNILAFGNTLNDYDYTLYVWRPDKTSYEKKDP